MHQTTSWHCFFTFQTHLKKCAPHPRHVHEHDPRVDARRAVEGVACETAVPGNAGLLVLWGHGRQLRGIKARQKGPQLVYRLQEEDIWVDVDNWVDILQDQLHGWEKKTDNCQIQYGNNMEPLSDLTSARWVWQSKFGFFFSSAYMKLTGKNSLWEAQGLKSFFHSAAFSLGKLME